jgi:hypothetical protein
VTTLTTDCCIGVETKCDIKNDRIKLMKFVNNCDSNDGASSCPSVRKYPHKGMGTG